MKRVRSRTTTWLAWPLALLSVSLAVASLIFSLGGVLQSAAGAGAGVGGQLPATALEPVG